MAASPPRPRSGRPTHEPLALKRAVNAARISGGRLPPPPAPQAAVCRRRQHRSRSGPPHRNPARRHRSARCLPLRPAESRSDPRRTWHLLPRRVPRAVGPRVASRCARLPLQTAHGSADPAGARHGGALCVLLDCRHRLHGGSHRHLPGWPRLQPLQRHFTRPVSGRPRPPGAAPVQHTGASAHRSVVHRRANPAGTPHWTSDFQLRFSAVCAHLNGGGNPADESRPIPARQTVWHDAAHPSALILPIAL